MKKLTFLVLISALIFLFVSPLYAVSNENFVLNIVHKDVPVKEIDRRVAIPFDTEYKIRLKNENDRKATAKVFIDGILVSKLGDFILDSKGEIDLERFLDSSLTEGRRFKFVRLDHPDVDDPTKEENGIVRVEFRLERKVEVPKIQFAPKINEGWHFLLGGDGLSLDFQDKIPPLSFTTQGNVGIGSTSPSAILDIWNGNSTINTSANFTSMSNSNIQVFNNASTAPGATIAGSASSQVFGRAHVDVEDVIYALELRIVGIIEISYIP